MSTGAEAIETCRKLINEIDQLHHQGDYEAAHWRTHDLAFAFEALVVGHKAWLAGLREPVRVGKEA